MDYTLPIVSASLYCLGCFKIDELGSERIERLRDQRAYLTRFFGVDKRCLHYARCSTPGPKNIESAKTYSADEQAAITREYLEQTDLQRSEHIERESQKTTRKRARRIKNDAPP